MRMIIINGSTGVGKSTVARLLHKKDAMSFLLEVDEIRRGISQYAEHREDSGKLSHAIGRSIVRTVFEHGRDILLEQCMTKDDVIDSYRVIADEFSADIHEFILWAPKDLVLKRAHERGWHKGGLLTPEKCEQLWDKMNVFKNQRLLAQIINVSHLTPEQISSKIGLSLS